MFYKFRNLKGKHQITENIYLPIYEWRGGGRKDKRKKKKKPLFSAYNEPDCVRHCYMFYWSNSYHTRE